MCDECDEAQLAVDIAEAEEEVAAATRRLESAKRWLKELQEKVPPFKKGQHVTPQGRPGAVFIVDDVARAFGDWVVLGHFNNGLKPYTYPAKELVAEC